MENLEKIVLDMLVPIFPNLTKEVLEVSVTHPSNHRVPLSHDSLLQRCIDDLLELRTYTEKSLTTNSVTNFLKSNPVDKALETSNPAAKALETSDSAAYRQPSAIVHSDESSDSEKDVSNEDQTTISIHVGVKPPVKITGHTPANGLSDISLQKSANKSKDVIITGHTPAKDVVFVSESLSMKNETSSRKRNKTVNMKKYNDNSMSNLSKTFSVESTEAKLLRDDMYREIDFSSDSNSCDLLTESKLLYSSDEEKLPALSSPIKPLRPSSLTPKDQHFSGGPDFSNWRDTLNKSKSSSSVVAADKSILEGRNELKKSQTIPMITPSSSLGSLSKPENREVTATVNFNNNKDMKIDITVNVSDSSGNKKATGQNGSNVPITNTNVRQNNHHVSPLRTIESNKPGPSGLQSVRIGHQSTPELSVANSRPMMPSSYPLANLTSVTNGTSVGQVPVISSCIAKPSGMPYVGFQRNPQMTVSYPKPSDPLRIRISNAAVGSSNQVPVVVTQPVMPTLAHPIIPQYPGINLGPRPLVSNTVSTTLPPNGQMGIPLVNNTASNPVSTTLPPYGRMGIPLVNNTVSRPISSTVTQTGQMGRPLVALSGGPLVSSDKNVARILANPFDVMPRPTVPQFNCTSTSVSINPPNMQVMTTVNLPRLPQLSAETLDYQIGGPLKRNMASTPAASNASRSPRAIAAVGGSNPALTAGPSFTKTALTNVVNHPLPAPLPLDAINIADRDLNEPVIIGEERPVQVVIPEDEEETQEMRTRKAKDNLRREMVTMFPDVDPTYVDQLYDRFLFMDWQLIINTVCNHLLEDPNYPKKETPVVVPQEMQKPSPDYYKEFTSWISGNYRIQCENLLMSEFKWISLKDIRKVMSLFNGHYAPSHKVMTEIMKNRSKEYAKIKETQPYTHAYSQATTQVMAIGVSGEKSITIKFLKCGRPHKSDGMMCHELILEKEFIRTKTEEETKEKDRELAVTVNEHEYEEIGQLIECGCCYGEVAFEMMVQCYDGHLFCQECLERYAQESVFGHGKADLLCMTDGCDASYPISQLQKALPSNILSKYEDRVQEENINLADMSDLVRCPHCDFAALMDPGDKVFKCHNMTCLKETCRYCKEGWKEHFGKRCDEIEKKDEVKLRLQFEEKMTEAKIRACHKCKAKFTKSDGCNKMTCRCGAKMCYICRKPNIDYDHFCRHFRDPNKGKACTECSSCSLWTNPEQDDERAVAEIKKEAEETRKAMGYTEEKLIGAPDEPPNKKKRLDPPGNPH